MSDHDHPFGVLNGNERVIRDIAAAASSLPDRLSGRAVRPGTGTGNERLREERWNHWASLLSKDDPDFLTRRLEFSGIDTQTARASLGQVSWTDGSELPSWAAILRRATETPCDEPGLSGASRWEAFHARFLQVAKSALETRAGPRLGRLAPGALSSLLEALRGRMVFASDRVLDLEFSLDRATVPSFVFDDAESRARFVLRRLESGLFRDYPVLGRILGTVVEFWVETAAEFLERLDTDFSLIREKFFHGGDPGRIESLSASLSDPHRRGRGVIVASFSNGKKLVYKPRSTGLEAAYFHVVDWLNRKGSPASMTVLSVLDRGDHGWMEFLDHRECADPEEAGLYFERAGSLLALLYALAGADIHYENVIAHGAQPVPVDLEILMAPLRDVVGDVDPAAHHAFTQMEESVLAVGLLPNWMQVRKGKAVDIGGLEAAAKEEGFGDRRHLPRLNGQPIPASQHSGDIVRGFEAMYEFLRNVQESLLAPGSPLEAFRGLPVRFVNRATALYVRALTKASSPAALESGAARSMELDVFIKSAMHADESIREDLRAVCESEIADMERGDVPFFQGRVDSRDLELGLTGRKLEGFFRRTGYSIAERRIRNLSPADLSAQKKFIRQAFDLMGTSSGSIPARPRRRPDRGKSFAAEAASIARTIRDDAILHGNGVSWIAPQLIPNTDAFRLTPAGMGLYDGLAGAMIFLLAMEKYAGDRESGALGRRIIASLHQVLKTDIQRILIRQMPLGTAGMGGVVYALCLASQLANEPRALAAAVEFSALVSEERVRRDKTHDYMAGAAGAIPAWLILHELTGDTLWLDRATFCGNHLLASREKTPAGSRSWKCLDRFLSGYSHGAAGIAASLLRLHAAGGEIRFLDAAREAIEYENTLFDPAVKNWRDLREQHDDFMVSWCHGAPGIALGRLQGLPSLDGERIRFDVASALDTTANFELPSADHCCCGSAGRANILLTASKRLGRGEFRDQAAAIVHRSMTAAEELDGYASTGHLPRSVRGPGFFHGLSGIGYTLLRFDHPELPDVLATEI